MSAEFGRSIKPEEAKRISRRKFIGNFLFGGAIATIAGGATGVVIAENIISSSAENNAKERAPKPESQSLKEAEKIKSQVIDGNVINQSDLSRAYQVLGQNDIHETMVQKGRDHGIEALFGIFIPAVIVGTIIAFKAGDIRRSDR